MFDPHTAGWEEFKSKFERKYDSENEEQYRRKIFMETKHKIDQHNQKYEAGEVSFSMGINQFADLNDDERKNICCGNRTPKVLRLGEISIDCRQSDAVTPVEDQGHCGVYLVFSAEDMKAKLAEAGNKLVIVDFFATWCAPCQRIAPQLEELSKERPEIVFLKVDVDDNEGLAAEYEIASMPTFVFIKNGKKVDSFSGASLDRLKSTIEKYQ